MARHSEIDRHFLASPSEATMPQNHPRLSRLLSVEIPRFGRRVAGLYWSACRPPPHHPKTPNAPTEIEAFEQLRQ